MSARILTITLNPAVDKTAQVPNFKLGDDFREQGLSVSAGGKGINVSRILKSLGVNTVASGFLGGTSGQFIKKEIARENINQDFLSINENSRTSLSIIDPKNNVITRILERGPKITRDELNLFRKKFLTLIEHFDYVVLSGRSIPGAPDSIYGGLIAAAKKKKTLSVLDTTARPFDLGLKRRPFMIKPNLKEAEQFFQMRLVGMKKLQWAVGQLYKQGIEIVTLTLGSRGVIAFNGQEMILAVPPHVKRKNPVGCGDSFIGGFLAAHSQKKSFEECIKIGVACGTANVLSVIPGNIKLGAMRNLLNKIQIKQL